MAYEGFKLHKLDKLCRIWSGSIPRELALKGDDFEALWDLHPKKYHVITMCKRRLRSEAGGGREVQHLRRQYPRVVVWIQV